MIGARHTAAHRPNQLSDSVGWPFVTQRNEARIYLRLLWTSSLPLVVHLFIGNSRRKGGRKAAI